MADTEQSVPDDDDDDFIDGCEVDFTEDPDDEETAELRPLFPDGVADEAKAADWVALATAPAPEDEA